MLEVVDRRAGPGDWFLSFPVPVACAKREGRALSGVSNGDGTPVSDLFGCLMPENTGATGSVPSRTAPPDDALPDQMTGIPGVGATTPLAAQAGPGENASSIMPGQNDLGLPGASHDPGYADSGAGEGHNFADQHRYPWQQQPGRMA
jgi:hypothetical protein